MRIFRKTIANLTKATIRWHYDAVQAEIDELHDEIDTLSVRLGELVKLKCKIEAELNKQEQ